MSLPASKPTACSPPEESPCQPMLYTSPSQNCNETAPVKVFGVEQHALKGICIINAALQGILCQELHFCHLRSIDHLLHKLCKAT